MTVDMRLEMQIAIAALEQPPLTAYAQIQSFCKRSLESIAGFLHTDPLFLHYTKKELLRKSMAQLEHIQSIARYAQLHNDVTQIQVLKNELHSLAHSFDLFANMGVVYLFRHCNKNTNKKSTVDLFKIISEDTLKKQAFTAAKQICAEVSLSIKPVHVILHYSDMERTKVFAEVVLRQLQRINKQVPNKVRIDAAEDTHLMISKLWDEKGDAEYQQIMARENISEDQACFNWIKNRGGFAIAKYQPSPQIPLDNALSFFNEMNQIANSSTNEHVMILGFSHGPVLQAAINALYPHVETTVETAGFLKKECGQFCYLGKWV